MAHRRVLLTLIVASAERLKSFLFKQSLPQHFVVGKYTSPMKLILLLSYPQSGVNVLHIAIALNYFTLVCNVTSVLVEMVKFEMVKNDIFRKNKKIAVYFKLFDGKYASIVVSKSEQ